MSGDDRFSIVPSGESPEESMARLAHQSNPRAGRSQWGPAIAKNSLRCVAVLVGVALVWFIGIRPVMQEIRLDKAHVTAPATVLRTEADEGGTDQVFVRLNAIGPPQDYSYTPPMFWPGPQVGSQIDVEFLPADPTVMREAGSHEWFVPLLDLVLLLSLVGWLWDALLHPWIRRLGGERPAGRRHDERSVPEG